jgi:rhodanese-related sulfurtransferase
MNNMKEIIEKGAFLVDVRTPEEFAEGHVNASVNIPLDQLSERLSELEGKQHIVVFCKSGMRSEMAKSFLEQAGFNAVTNGGGWLDIKALID